ncbi:MAG: hypothetical protein ACTSQ8_17500 [Candidatus Helarchaeota archaeon]
MDRKMLDEKIKKREEEGCKMRVAECCATCLFYSEGYENGHCRLRPLGYHCSKDLYPIVDKYCTCNLYEEDREKTEKIEIMLARINMMRVERMNDKNERKN